MRVSESSFMWYLVTDPGQLELLFASFSKPDQFGGNRLTGCQKKKPVQLLAVNVLIRFFFLKSVICY